MNLRETFSPELVAAIEALVADRVAEALAEHGSGSPWFTIEEAAAYLRVSERTLERLLRRQKIRASTIGRRRLLHRDDLDRHLRTATREDVAPTTPPRRRRRTLDAPGREA